MGTYLEKGKVKYLTGAKITELRNTSIVTMKHLKANVTVTLSEKAYNLSNTGAATPDVPAQVSEDDMGHYEARI